MAKIEVLNRSVTVQRREDQDYISLTDIVRYKDASAMDDLIRSWVRNRNTVEFLGIWEQLNNPAFNPVEFDGMRKQAGLNSFTLTKKMDRAHERHRHRLAAWPLRRHLCPL
jgi:hypothetical protein